MRFVEFMNTMAGRLIRIVVGFVLVIAGLLIGGTAGWIVGVVGVVPMAAGVFNFCLLAPLFHAPMHRAGPHGV